MKRNRFIAAILALASTPLLSFTETVKKAREKGKGFKIGAGEGRIHGHIKLKGVNSNILDVKISGTDTEGNLAIFEQTSLSPGRGTPLHFHNSQDEVFYVIEGAYVFQVGDDRYNLSAGESIFLPMKIPHAWTQKSEKGKMLVILQPAGKLEQFFVSTAALDHEPTPAEMAAIFKANGMEVVGPPLKIS